MEFLKKRIAIFLLLVVFGVSASAQVSPSKVFENSYAKEAAGDYQGAINDLVGLNGFDYHKSLRLGWLYYLSKNFDISIYYYQQAVKLRPKAVEALLGLCNPLEALSKIDQLEATYKKILAIDPMNSKINYALGNIYYYQKNFILAEKHFDLVIDLYPFDYYSNLMAGWTKYFLDKKNEAKILFNTVLIISPSNKSAKEGLALIK
ncbi:MAG: tetratricopeptide repeat protein [Bacteroidales bacterium]|jgi:tetratricopeptide (TPR) repeat protein|nr:tetratricopeptide repeat protein [Bacteroidales bacterium]MDI9593092.1 tetratricopeptide repeat protein [Bacteroidota bacterium]OQC36688.1 MAG: Tetratricopeptide repeat protein [Bacteroidetes bacterium ADurb.Bin041]MBP7873705.1 tetratricopeptide repeat protein [Bacteroidales bacterium]MCO6467629.1 tetratricopeptide repeat protein [Bacteroidales bacterium]